MAVGAGLTSRLVGGAAVLAAVLVAVLETPAPAADSALIIRVTTTAVGQTVALPLGGTVDVQVDWNGGGTASPFEAPNTATDQVQNYSSVGAKSFTYDDAGTYDIVITGSLTAFGSESPWTGAEYITAVLDFGAGDAALGLTSLAGAFHGASGLTDVPGFLPSTVTDVERMFRGASVLNDADIAAWDVSRVTNMAAMFDGARAFNRDIGGWDVSAVTTMAGMFYGPDEPGASAFNQDIGNWVVSNVTDMESMFHGAAAFDQDIGDWDVSSVTNMQSLFDRARIFNQDLSDWDVSNVTNMNLMFWFAEAFNGDVTTWDTGSVTTMDRTFRGADAFDRDISGWNTSSVTTMSRMFWGADAFNQDISAWDVSQVADMGKMFEEAAAFDQDLSSWCVRSITTEPTDFATNATSWNTAGRTPVWGTCPGAAAPIAGGSSPTVDCAPATVAVGDTVTCAVTGGDPGLSILWRASYNPTFATGGVTLDQGGAGSFTFTVPAAAIGRTLSVELVEWGPPVVIVETVVGRVPRRIPAGGGPAASIGTAGDLLGVGVALAGAMLIRSATRRGRRPARMSG